MLRISGYQQRKNAEGKPFIVLELEGSLQILPAQTTGQPYASVPKCTIPSTFDEATARELVGSTIEGEIIRVSCDPYSFPNPQTKEPVTLNYKYSYKAPENASKEPITIFKKKAEVEVM